MVKSEKLTWVELTGIDMTRDSWVALSQGVAGCPSLKKLSFHRMTIDFEGLDYIAEASKLNGSLEKLDLSCNDMSDDYGPIIAKFV
jgi:hypothetical protein